MSLTFAQRMALGAERSKYRRRLQEVMDNKGLSGAALARELGVSSQAVYSTLAGKIHSPIAGHQMSPLSSAAGARHGCVYGAVLPPL